MRQTTKRLYSRAAAMLLMMLLTTMTAWAETENLGGYEFTIGTDGEGQYYKVDCKEALDAIATFVNGGGYTGGKRFKQTANITYTHTTDWNDANSTENNYTAIFGVKTNSLMSNDDIEINFLKKWVDNPIYNERHLDRCPYYRR